LEDFLPKSDKDLFIKFRESKITFNQFKARVYNRLGIINYNTFDDFLETLPPDDKKKYQEEVETARREGFSK